MHLLPRDSRPDKAVERKSGVSPTHGVVAAAGLGYCEDRTLTRRVKAVDNRPDRVPPETGLARHHPGSGSSASSTAGRTALSVAAALEVVVEVHLP
jgi:hypothetical protein